MDEATNTTSYLLVLQSNKLLKYHTVAIPFSKGDLLKGTLQGDPIKYWPHWTAVIQETKTGQKYAVNSWIYENGENPAWSRSRTGTSKTSPAYRNPPIDVAVEDSLAEAAMEDFNGPQIFHALEEPL